VLRLIFLLLLTVSNVGHLVRTRSRTRVLERRKALQWLTEPVFLLSHQRVCSCCFHPSSVLLTLSPLI
jgi:hypothetical protein